MKLKLLISTAIGVVLVAAVVLISIGHYGSSQYKLDRNLAKACDSANGYAAAYWLAKGANVNTTAGDGAPGETPLIRCAHLANTDLVEMLLMLGADPNAIDDYGHATALHKANFASVADTLVIYGADLNKTNKDGLTALQFRLKPNVYKDDELIAALKGNGPRAKAREEGRRMVEEANKERKLKKEPATQP